MTLANVIGLVNFIIDKDIDGNTITPNQANILLDAINLELFESEYKKLLQLSAVEGKYISRFLDRSPIKTFVKHDEKDITDGKMEFPENFAYPVLLEWYAITKLPTKDGQIRQIEVVDETEFGRRRSTLSRRPPGENPFAVVRDDGIHIIPNNLAKVQLTYLCKPATPILDYCIDNITNNVVFLTTTMRLVPAGALLTVHDQTLGLLYSNVTYRYVVTSTQNSLTVELAWDALYHEAIVNRILQKVGVSLDSRSIEQYSQLEEQKGA